MKPIAMIIAIFIILAALFAVFKLLDMARHLPGAESDPLDEEAEMWQRAFAGIKVEPNDTRRRY